jgi:hypothetical protein
MKGEEVPGTRTLLVGIAVLLIVLIALVAVLSLRQPQQAAQQPAQQGPTTENTKTETTKTQATKAKSAPKTSPQVAMGETATLANGDHQVTVYSYTSSVAPANQFSTPKPGNEFSVIDAEGCAGNAQMSLNPQSFGLQMPDNSRLDPAFSSAVEPRLNLTNLGTGDCARGYVTFETPQRQTPSFVLFEQPSAPPVKWAV